MNLNANQNQSTPKSPKIKLSDLAKDLSVNSQEIIDFLASSPSVALSQEQLAKASATILQSDANRVIEHFSQKNQVESFDSFNNNRTPPPATTATNPPPTKMSPTAANTPNTKINNNNNKAPIPGKKVIHQLPNTNNNVRPNTLKNINTNTAASVNRKPNNNTTPKPLTAPAVATTTTKSQAQSQAPANTTHTAPAPTKATFSRNQNQNYSNVPPVQEKHRPSVSAPPKPQNHGLKQHLKTNLSESVTSTALEQNLQKVDTRGNYVELEKYNEKYEKIAPSQQMPGKGRHDSFSKKQKITQKSQQYRNRQYSNKRETESEKIRRLELERARKQQLKVLIPDNIIVSELAIRLKVTANDVIKKLMVLGVMAAINETVDFDTAALVAEELGAKVEKEVIVTIEERLIADEQDDETHLMTRSPVVVVMGHVDHGKTSLLDSIRDANVTASEAGGITQHIGAYRVFAGNQPITFLDTPGHAAFTSMRARGAQVTDIAIIVVAADDGIMPQSVEAINHAKAAGVGIIVAINKTDKPAANVEKVKQELTEHGLVIEEWGGDIICVPVSAKSGEGIPQLLEMVTLLAETKELRANPNRLAKGTVIEARLDKGKGPTATILVQNGTLRTSDVIIAGTAVGRVRVMTDDKGNIINEAGPSVPVEITGLAEVPSAGDIFNAVEDEKLARELVEQRRHEAKQEQFQAFQKVTLDNLFSQIAEGEIKELPIIVKADVQGSVEAVKQSLEKISNEEVRVKVIHGGVGAVSESDVMLADASNAIIIGFNVRPDPVAAESAQKDGVDIRLYRIIYDAIQEVETAMKGMLAPKFRCVEQGRVEVRQVYKISNVGAVAGSYVLSGKVTRSSQIRVVRDGIVITEDTIDSLKRFKDDVKDVATNYECGIGLSKFNDIKEGDILEAFIMEEYRD